MEILDLADWRERVARMYLSGLDLGGFRSARDRLFAEHAQSPIPPQERATFAGLRYFPENPEAVVEVPLEPATGAMEIDTGGPDGVDLNVSAAKVPPWKREQLGKWLPNLDQEEPTLGQTGRFDVILAWKLDRLVRSVGTSPSSWVG